MLLQQIVNGVVIGSVYALTALGATFVYGILRILDISNAGAYAVGAYAGFFIYSATENIWGAFLLAMGITGLLGVGIHRLVFAPIMDKSPNVSLIASIGLFICIEDILRLAAGPQIKDFKLHSHLPNLYFDALGLTVYGSWIMVLAVTLILLALLWYFLNYTRLGLAWRATAQDSEIAKAIGINTGKVTALNFFLGYAFAAAAGIMVGLLYSSISPTMGDTPAYKMLAIIVLGGLGNPSGTVLAAMLIGLTETLIGGYIGFFLPRDAIAFIVLIIILLLRPQGLLGRRTSR